MTLNTYFETPAVISFFFLVSLPTIISCYEQFTNNTFITPPCSHSDHWEFILKFHNSLQRPTVKSELLALSQAEPERRIRIRHIFTPKLKKVRKEWNFTSLQWSTLEMPFQAHSQCVIPGILNCINNSASRSIYSSDFNTPFTTEAFLTHSGISLRCYWYIQISVFKILRTTGEDNILTDLIAN